MANYNNIQRRREQFSRSTEENMNRKVKALQTALYSALIEAFAGFVVDESGKFANSMANHRKARQVRTVVSSFNKTEGKSFLGWVFKKLMSLAGLNQKYFREVSKPPLSTNEKVLKNVMYRYGYDLKNDRIISGGYLSGLFSSEYISNRVSRLISQAIGAKMPMDEFRKNFKTVFLNPGGAGMLEHHYNTFVRDLYQGFDRTLQMEYKNELGLSYALYSGTIKDNTREFCKRRVNNLYKEDFINAWNGENWKGKNPYAPVQIALGGYNCRHHLSWISDELAEKLIKTKGLNQYN